MKNEGVFHELMLKWTFWVYFFSFFIVVVIASAAKQSRNNAAFQDCDRSNDNMNII